MKKLHVTSRYGETRTIDWAPDFSVMEAVRDSGFDELLALCGGCASCATCHVYVDDEAMDRLPPVNQDEDDLLDSSDHRQANSRLSCQIEYGSEVEEISLTIAPED